MKMSFILSVSACFFLFSSFSVVLSLSHPPLLGVHPLDEKYFARDVIMCKDDSKSFTRDRLNDDFCDCVDGTDEPGTSACPAGKFYCRNIGSTPQFIFSSRVNDRICDCCDGSDENDGSLNCPNTCIMGGTVEYKTDHRFSRVHDLGNVDTKQTNNGVTLDDFIGKEGRLHKLSAELLMDSSRYMYRFQEHEMMGNSGSTMFSELNQSDGHSKNSQDGCIIYLSSRLQSLSECTKLICSSVHNCYGPLGLVRMHRSCTFLYNTE